MDHRSRAAFVARCRETRLPHKMPVVEVTQTRFYPNRRYTTCSWPRSVPLGPARTSVVTEFQHRLQCRYFFMSCLLVRPDDSNVLPRYGRTYTAVLMRSALAIDVDHQPVMIRVPLKVYYGHATEGEVIT